MKKKAYFPWNLWEWAWPHTGAERRCITEGTVVQLPAVFMPSTQLRNRVLSLITATVSNDSTSGSQIQSWSCFHAFLLAPAVPVLLYSVVTTYTLRTTHLDFTISQITSSFFIGKYCACSRRILYFMREFQLYPLDHTLSHTPRVG